MENNTSYRSFARIKVDNAFKAQPLVHKRKISLLFKGLSRVFSSTTI